LPVRTAFGFAGVLHVRVRAPAAMEATMTRRSTLGLSAIVGLALVLLPNHAAAQQKQLKDQLVGTWTVVSWDQTTKDGGKLQRFGANPKGVNVFDANGRFVVVYARADLPKIASNNPSNPTPEEAKAIVGGAISYFGTYTVDEAGKTLILRIEASSFPNQLGVEQKRIITSLTATELKYSNPTPTTGGTIDVAFRRADRPMSQ
jgi:Lipocalin-like domain